MNLQEKVEKARQAIDYMLTHHDAPKAEIIAELSMLKAYADDRMKSLDGERARHRESLDAHAAKSRKTTESNPSKKN